MKKNIFKHTLAFVALLVVCSPAHSSPFRPTTVALGVQRLATQGPLFELQWAFVDGFIASHAVVPNDDVRLALKNETSHGVKTWSCSGPQVGWPEAAANSQSVITFATSDDARTCAQLIQDILVAEAALH